MEDSSRRRFVMHLRPFLDIEEMDFVEGVLHPSARDQSAV